MGTIVQILGGTSAEDNAIEYLSPVRRGIDCIHFANTSKDKALRNFVYGKTKGQALGDFDVQPNYTATANQNAGISTSMTDSLDLTWFCVMRGPDTQTGVKSAAYVGNYGGTPATGTAAANSGMSFYGNLSSGVLNFSYPYATDANPNTVLTTQVAMANTPLAVQQNWSLLSLRCNSATQIEAINHTVSESTVYSSAFSATRRRSILMNRTVRLGGHGLGSFTAGCQIAAFQGHKVALTDIERAQVIADLRGYMARRGVTV